MTKSNSCVNSKTCTAKSESFCNTCGFHRRLKPECIFVSAPYSGTKEEKEYREKYITEYVGSMMGQGKQAYSPVVFGCAVVRVCDVPDDYTYWVNHCKLFISVSTEVHVLMLDGWNESTGVIDEVSTAKELGIPVKYILTL